MLVIGQGTAAVRGPEPRRRPPAGLGPDRSPSRRCLPPSSPGSASRADMSDTLDRRDQPERHDHRHEPHGRPRTGTRRAGDRDRQPPQQRPRRQVRRRALHVRRAGRRDERGVDQGVLRADRRRLPARARDRATSTGSLAAEWAGRAAAAGCGSCPTAMEAVLAQREHDRRDRASARAVDGATGRSSATARTASPRSELRIKLSELCYKSIACDVTEDKKHIDLSAEPLILVCAAGLSGSNADDVAQGGRDLPRPQGRADRDRHRGRAAVRRRARDDQRPAGRTRRSASCSRRWPGTSSATRRRWRSTPRRDPLREARALRSKRCSTEPERRPARTAGPPARGRRRRASSTACATAATTATSKPAPRCASRRCCGTRPASCRSTCTSSSSARSARPSTVVEDLTAALTGAIEQLTRPVDAIKHQAKTVTVGISRSDETLLQVALVREVLATGAARDSLSYRALRTLVELDPAVEAVIGFTRYRIEGDVDRRRHRDDPRGRPGRHVGEHAVAHRSRARSCIGTKHRVAIERRGHGGAGAARRPHARHRARGEGQPDHRAHAAPRDVP